MSRARDLADIVSGGFDVPLASLDNVPASNDASALTTGTLPSARLPATLPARDGSALTNLSATNLTGVIPTANFPAFLPAVSGALGVPEKPRGLVRIVEQAPGPLVASLGS